MHLHQAIPLKDLGILNQLVEDYLSEKDSTKVLYRYAPSLEGIADAMQTKANFPHRTLLQKALKEQYKDLEVSSAVQQNIALLANENTFTVCTAHQLCLLTGPNYFIYKILSAIKLCSILKEKYPTNNFVPVYWMGSEDHDFEEINHAHVYSKTLIWENEGKGAVGNLSLTGFDKIIEELQEILGDKVEAQNLLTNLKKHFSNKSNYGKAFQSWILDLFKDSGLLVLDQDDALLKSSFADVITAEFFEQKAEKALIANERHLQEHYHVQASSRPINFFYLADNLRERIERNGETFKVLNSNISFTEDTLKEEIHSHPERFSPNVILRPVYQETVLPNVAFIGGPGEVSYWLQLKDVFETYNRVPPAIMLRDMAVVMPKNQLEKLESWGISISDLFSSYDQIAKSIVEEESTNELDLILEKKSVEDLFTAIKEKAIVIDKNLDRSVEAEKQKVLNALSNIESKLIRAEKKNFEQKLSQLENIQSKLLPENTLQERYTNFIPYYVYQQEDYFNILLEKFDASAKSLKVFEQ